MSNDELPPGWVWISKWDSREGNESKKKGPTGDYQRLLRAAEQRKVRAYKQGSRWAINAEDASSFLASVGGGKAADMISSGKLQELVDGVWATQVAVDQLRCELNEFKAAVQSLAAQKSF